MQKIEKIASFVLLFSCYALGLDSYILNHQTKYLRSQNLSFILACALPNLASKSLTILW